MDRSFHSFPSTSASAGRANLASIDESSPLDWKKPKEKFLEILDVLENHVESLRKQATNLEEDRDLLLSTLDSVRNADMMLELSDNDKDDVCHYADRITNRCLTVEVKILTQRDQMQEDALHQVNQLIDRLVVSVRGAPESARAKCVSYMNACTSNAVQGIPDKKFESALLGCTGDDQKRVKKRLEGLLQYINKSGQTATAV